MKPTWKKYLLYGSGVGIGGILAYVLIETIRAKNTGFETKTLWDWMELLVIPIVLAIGAFYLERSERTVDRKTAEDRAKLERELATDRQQEAALQGYLDRMAELLLKEKLRTTKNKEVRNVARIRTLTVLRGLDGKRKGMVLLFLHQSGLITEKPVIELYGADLSFSDLRGISLTRADLSGTNLNWANLQGTDLHEANFSMARLHYSDLSIANLMGSKFIGASLFEANLTWAQLSNAILIDAELRGAELWGARLDNAYLSGATLGGAKLRDTDMTDAKVSKEELATAETLEGATMPDGTKHD